MTTLDTVAGPVAELHGSMPEMSERRAIVRRASDAAVVLGSTQSEDVVDQRAAERLGVAVVRRRSGGGAVAVAPSEPTWVDVVIPADDPWHRDDVGRAAAVVGRAWEEVLVAAGIDCSTHTGPMRPGRWGRLVCFAGTGTGEVISPAGAKLVGISQRRTRQGALLQCALYRRWDPSVLVEVLALSDADRRQLELDLRLAGTAVIADHDEVVAALADRLAGAPPAL